MLSSGMRVQRFNQVGAQDAVQGAARQVKRQNLVVKASAEDSRRNVLKGAALGLILTPAAFASNTGSKVIIQDQDSSKNATGQTVPLYSDEQRTGVKTIRRQNEAQDPTGETPQQIRSGYEQYKKDVGSTKDRVAQSTDRLNSLVSSQIQNGQWSDLQTELRRQLYYLRQDFDTLIAQKPKQSQQQGQSLAKDFFFKLEQLDIAGRNQNKQEALKNFDAVKESLRNASSFLS